MSFNLFQNWSINVRLHLLHRLITTSLSSEDDFEISNFQNFECTPRFPINSTLHNFEITQFSRMESDCKDQSPEIKHDPTMSNQDAILQMLDAISSRMMQNYQTLQDQLTQTTLEVQRITQDNDTFHHEVRQELNVLRSASSVSTVLPPAVTPTVNSTNPSPSVVMPSDGGSTQLSTTSNPGTPVDFQAQMLLMLNETFSKLSTALTDNKTAETKSDWPKFSGDSKKFRTWYLAFMTQLSIPPWSALYNSVTNTVVSTTSEVSLNSKLYAKLISSLEGSALQNMVARKHIRANGLLLLKELQQMYLPNNVPEMIAAKTGEFWSNTKRMSYETVDAYYNRFQDLLEDLSEADEVISDKSAIRNFIFTLGSEFESIRNSYRLGNLPPEWMIEDWPTILVLCRDYYNSINPQGPPKKDTLSDQGSLSQAERNAHHKKVRQWFMNPAKFYTEIANEQRKHTGKCIYHLLKSHATEDCHIKKECEKAINEKKTSSSETPTSATTGRLRHLTEEPEDIEVEDNSDVLPDPPSNDTNEDDLMYFVRMSKHYLQLVNSSTSRQDRHSMHYPIIADSGANFHMFREPDFIEFITPANGHVVLGDGTTTKGLRHIQMKENRVRENIATNFVKICHVDGKLNIADIFTKEMKDTNHFVTLRNLFMCSRNQF